MKRFVIFTFLLGFTFQSFLTAKIALEISEQSGGVNVFSDDVLGWDFKDYSKLGFNNCGVRDPLNCEEISKVTDKKVLFLGNSVVLGKDFTLNEVFTKKIQSRLGEGYYTINAGYDGYEVFREFYKYKRDLTNLDIDMVVWLINRNDLRRQSTLKDIIKETKEVQSVVSKENKVSFISAFNSNFFTLNGIKALNSTFVQLTETWVGGWKDQYYLSGFKDKPDQEIVDVLISEIISFQGFLEQRGTRFLVVFVPDRSFCKFYGPDDSGLFSSLSPRLVNANISHELIHDGFCTKGNSETLYIDYVHLSLRGHETLSKYLASIISNYF
jgi:hypothetical protein